MNIETRLRKIFWQYESFYTGEDKKLPLYILLTILFFALLFLSFYFKIQVPDGTLTTFFSTIAQGLIALAGVVSISIIYKLQILSSQEKDHIHEFIQSREYWYPGFNPSSQEISLETVSEILESVKVNLPENLYLYKNKLKLQNQKLIFMKQFCRDYVVDFSVLSFLVVALSLIAQLFSVLISKHYLGICVVYIIFLLTVYLFTLVVKSFQYYLE